MNPYVNEDVMWQRLKDMQLEAENRRLLGNSPGLFALLRFLAGRAWLLAGLAARRPPRRSWVETRADGDARSRVA
jgi:hypothetical protein